MRIAFASCMFNRVFASQPVWGWIAQQQPDHLVLLGDSLYLDIASNTGVPPQLMSELDFASHLHSLYTELLTQPDFSTLANAMQGRVHAIWDDHDFLWDNAEGAELTTVHGGKIRLSTAFLESFRDALAQGLGTFPAGPGDARFWNPQQPVLTTPSLQLAPDVFLHLTDGRTHRTRTWLLKEAKRTIFGAAQLAQFATIIGTQPQALHVWASGSTVAGYQRFQRDLAWLKGQAAQQRMLVLSGDIHRNELDAFFTGGFPLHEATSSGAGVRDAVVAGSALRNFGVLDIDAQAVTIHLFKNNQIEYQRVLNRQTWLPQ